ncbi:MAG: hypothetical protein LBD28_04795 [Tannerellaceae bacterium]|jgi:RNA polymerase sigma-70 factor (ECF subfamily)|nr:hypothetical protein [Tannerellaceae bacterium]
MAKQAPHITDFDLIVKEFHGMVFRTVLGFLHVREDAEDITQEVFVKAYRNIEKFRGDSSLSTWIYAVSETDIITPTKALTIW